MKNKKIFKTLSALCAALVLMMLPTLVAYMFLQKHLTKGITAGAVKG